MKVLVIEDEADLRQELVAFLNSQGYRCEQAGGYAEAEDKLALYDYEVVLLDLTLPDGAGLDLLAFLRKEKPQTGVLIVSARDSLDDKLKGLDLGADDYITKPFHLSEINARMHALFRRKHLGGTFTLELGSISLDTVAKTVTYEGRPLSLTRKEYELLLYLAINRNRLISKEAIAENLWGDQYDLVDNFDFVYVHVKNLRHKLLAAGAGDLIRTVYGMGYKLSWP